jgi:hypothetical protein
MNDFNENNSVWSTQKESGICFRILHRSLPPHSCTPLGWCFMNRDRLNFCLILYHENGVWPMHIDIIFLATLDAKTIAYVKHSTCFVDHLCISSYSEVLIVS